MFWLLHLTLQIALLVCIIPFADLSVLIAFYFFLVLNVSSEILLCFCLESTNACGASRFVLCFLFVDDVLLHIKPLGQNTIKETNSSPLKELSAVGTCQGSLFLISLLYMAEGTNKCEHLLAPASGMWRRVADWSDSFCPFVFCVTAWCSWDAGRAFHTFLHGGEPASVSSSP